MPALLITATDTGAGKTFVTSLIVRALRARGVDAVGMKPFCCGDRTDAEELEAASDGCEPLNVLNPVWFRAPLAPWAASLVEQRPVDLALAKDQFHQLQARHDWVVVEGVGGWQVPLTESLTVAGLAVDWELPVLLVAADRLGVLNHTLLTVESLLRHPISFLGTLLNQLPLAEEDPSRMTNRALLEMLPGTEVLGGIEPHATLFPPRILDELMAKLAAYNAPNGL